MATANFLPAADAALVVGYGTANQAVVKGLNSMKLPDTSRTPIEASEFRRDFGVQFNGEGKYGSMQFSGYMMAGDTFGQGVLRAALKANSKLTDVRAYLNLLDFYTCDLAKDATSGFQVSNVSPGEANKNGLFPITVELLCNGDGAYFMTHLTASTIAIVSGGAGDATITDSASGFVTAGFEAGQTLIIEGSTADDGQYLIKTVAAGTLTLEGTADHAGNAITGEVAGDAITLHGGRF
ncbi:hypothetical protein [Megalodesulfovibrio gigas]|nr:hypothetical protein [Megalodesulfovibrio gigas]